MQDAGEIEAHLAKRIEDAAHARTGYNSSVKNLTRICLRQANSGIPPEAFAELVKMAYYKMKEGIATFDQFLLVIKQHRVHHNLMEEADKFSPEDLTLLKKAWKEGSEGSLPQGVKYLDEVSGGKLKGNPTKITPNLDQAIRRSLIRENESAEILAKNGYDIEQNPLLLNTNKKPDYLINGKIFDNYAPSTKNARNIATNIEKKILEEQTERIVLNLTDSEVELSKLTSQLKDYPIDGLKEIIIIKEEKVIAFYPF